MSNSLPKFSYARKKPPPGLSTGTQRYEDTAVRGHSGTRTHKYGRHIGTGTQRYGDTAVQGHIGTGAHWYGDTSVRGHI